MNKRVNRPCRKKVTKRFDAAIEAIAEYDLYDIMDALADQRGGTTPLYEAVARITEDR